MSELKTYWDLEEKERSALSETDVERYSDAELMLKGCLRVSPPQLDAEGSEPELPTRTYYRIGSFDVAFESSEQAEAFRKLKPLNRATAYFGGYQITKSQVEPIEGETVTFQASTSVDLAATKAALDKYAEKRSANKKRSDEYEKAIATQNKALEGLWEDWHRCRDLARRHRKVIDTFEAYVLTASGDRDVAARFLQKVFSVEQIEEAGAWFEQDIPTKFIKVEAIEPGPSHPGAPAEATLALVF
jgi:tetratricopeptide (TPR) repeat protein